MYTNVPVVAQPLRMTQMCVRLVHIVLLTHATCRNAPAVCAQKTKDQKLACFLKATFVRTVTVRWLPMLSKCMLDVFQAIAGIRYLPISSHDVSSSSWSSARREAVSWFVCGFIRIPPNNFSADVIRVGKFLKYLKGAVNSFKIFEKMLHENCYTLFFLT